jgi:hypothetical protein
MNPTDETSPTSKRSGSFAKKYPLQSGTFAVGLSLLILHKLIPWVAEHFFSSSIHSEWFLLILELLREFGMAAVVAAGVSIIYDLRYHHTTFSMHVQKAEKQVKESELSIAKANKELVTKMAEIADHVRASENRLNLATHQIEEHMSEVSQSVTQFSRVTKVALEERIAGLYHRTSQHGEMVEYDHKLREVITNAISSADRFVYLVGRGFDDSIYAKDSALWMWRAIENRSRQTNGRLNIRFLLANSLGEKAMLKDEYAFRCSSNELEDNGVALKNANRAVIKFLLKKFKEHPDKLAAMKIRLLEFSPPFAAIITEDALFVEQYLPYRRPGETIVMHVLRGSPKDHKGFRQKHEIEDMLINNPDKLLDHVMSHRAELESDLYLAHLKCFETLFSIKSQSLAGEMKAWMSRRAEKLLHNPKLRSEVDFHLAIADEMEKSDGTKLIMEETKNWTDNRGDGAGLIAHIRNPSETPIEGK